MASLNLFGCFEKGIWMLVIKIAELNNCHNTFACLCVFTYFYVLRNCINAHDFSKKNHILS